MGARTNTSTRAASDSVLIASFLAVLALVPIVAFTHTPAASDVEREFRRPAAMPAKPATLDAALAWPRAFEAWYRDHFGFRAQLIRLHNVAKLEGLGVSPTSEIVNGPDHWLFTTRDNAVGVYRGADPLSQRELELWTRVLEDRRAWCAERGIAYVFAIAPNKETIYPEHWPTRLDKIGPSRREQLVEFVRARSDFPLLDLTDALLAAKRDFAPEEVYFRLGTHWNDRGALYAAEALLARAHELVSRVAPIERERFSFEPTDFQDDSWAGRLYMDDLLRHENVEIDFEPRQFSRAYWEEVRARAARGEYDATSEHAQQHLPRAVVFHDSMGEKLRPLLAEQFSRCAFRWVSNFDTDVIEAEKPDIVIQVFVERALAAFSLSTSPMDTPERLEREFAASTRVLLAPSDALSSLDAFSTTKEPIELVREGDALRVRYGGGQLLLPELDVPADACPILRIEFDSPHATRLLLEFLARRFPEYSRNARSVTRPVQPGGNVVFVKLRVPDLTGRLRLQLGLVAGEYVLRSLEVRAASD